jgi:hypothetical protein
MPIPLPSSTCRYEDIQWEGSNLQELISSLRQKKRVPLQDTAHLDPDLVRHALTSRHPDWRPIFGQSGSPETQLHKMGVDDPSGDRRSRPVFLFFGWYREIRKVKNGYAYVRMAPNIHALFGWLQVEQKIVLTGREHREQVRRELPWAASHPHVACDCFDNAPNAIYVAPRPNSETDRLILDGRDTGLPASGMFRHYDPEVHNLTIEGCSRRNWRVPLWLYRSGAPELGMHTDTKRWTQIPNDPEHIHLRSVDRGQEFVFDSEEHETERASKWVERIVRAGQV